MVDQVPAAPPPSLPSTSLDLVFTHLLNRKYAVEAESPVPHPLCSRPPTSTTKAHRIMATTSPSQKDDISSTVPSDLNVQRPSHNYSRWKQDLISDMSKTPAESKAQAAQRVRLWEERIVGKRFIEHWWQRSASSVRSNQIT